MKKIILPIAAFATFSLASCQKDRTCSCTETTTVNGAGESTARTQTIGHATKKEARRATDCYSYTQMDSQTIMGTVYTRETKVACELK